MGQVESSEENIYIEDPQNCIDDSIDPFAPNLVRRRNRKRRNDVDEVVIKPEIKPVKKYKLDNFKTQLLENKCVLYHQLKPWLNKKVKFNLIAPVGKFPDRLDKYFAGKLEDINNKIPKEERLSKSKLDFINEKGNWYIPSTKFYDLQCKIAHDIKNPAACSMKGTTKTYVDEFGKNYKFISAVIFSDLTFKILDKKEYDLECEWWKTKYNNEEQNFGDIKKLYNRMKLGDHKEINNIREKIVLELIETLSKLNIGGISIETQSQIIEDHYYTFVLNSNVPTVLNYLGRVILLISFLGGDPFLYERAVLFNERFYEGNYNLDSLPSLGLREYIPEIMFSGNNSAIKQLQIYIKEYVSLKIEELISSSIETERGLIKQNKLKGELIEPEIEKRNIKDNCSNLDAKGLDSKFLVLYEDPQTKKVYCFNAIDIINDNIRVNPHTGKEFTDEFLNRVVKEFGYNLSRNVEDDFKNMKINEDSDEEDISSMLDTTFKRKKKPQNRRF
jgi:hypothetical protein